MEQTIQKQIQVDGSWVAVDVYGEEDGPAIILVPGVMADAAGWAEVARRLSGWKTVAVLNRRGRQPSGPLGDGYDIQTEVDDAAAVLREFSDVRTLFGWSYGGLIALHLANQAPVRHLIAYEPITAPFGAGSLPALERAHGDGDLDRAVEVALGEVSGLPAAVVESLRADSAVWAGLTAVSSPIFSETAAINSAPQPAELGQRAERIDLIVGERNRGQAPYGTSFEDVASRTARGVVHELAGQGHLAHLEAPCHLADLIDRLSN